MPLGSAYRVCVIPSACAFVFIFATNASIEPASHFARISAMLLPEAISTPSSSWRWLIVSPSAIGTTD